MRKYIGYFTLLVLALLIISFAADKKQKKKGNSLNRLGFKGHVQWVMQIPYHAIDSNGTILRGSVISDTNHIMSNSSIVRPEDNDSHYESWAFDTAGNILEYCRYHANGKLYNKEIHLYYTNGEVREVIDSFGSAMQIQQYTYTHDAKGRVLETNEWVYNTAHRENMTFKRNVNVYDPSGKMLEALEFNADTINPVSLNLYRYNEKGKLTELDKSKRQGGNDIDLVPSGKEVYVYDAKGRMIDKATYNYRAEPETDEKTTYDSAGKTVETYSYGQNRMLKGTVVKRTFNDSHTVQEDTYDGDGLLTDYTISHYDTETSSAQVSAKNLKDKGIFHVTYQRVTGNDGKLHNTEPGDTAMVRHIINDDYANIIEEDVFYPNGKPGIQKNYQYTYDSIGNWTEKVSFINNQPKSIIERQIVY